MEAYIFRGHCIRVVDGDTIDVVLDLGFGLTSKHRLRLYGINTSELHSPDNYERTSAQTAKEFVIEQVSDKDILVQTYKSDVFGRYLAKVFWTVDSTNDVYHCLNDMLIAEGLAVPYMTDKDLLK